MKNKIFYKFYLTFLFVFLLFFSCKKPKESSNTDIPKNGDLLSVIESYYAFTKTKVDGTFMFESNMLNNDPSSKESTLIGGVFYDELGNAQDGGGSVFIGNHPVSSSGQGTFGFNNYYSRNDFYGKKISFSFTPPPKNPASTREAGSATVTGTVYSPVDINITNVPPRTSVAIPSGLSTPITWNTDPNNPNGVVIMAEYLPTLYANRTTLGNGYKSFLSNSILVPDNGSTSIPWTFFSGFPSGSHLILWVARGNYAILSNGDYDYQVGGYSAAALWDVTVPAPPPNITITATNNSGFSISATYTNQGTGQQTSFTISEKGGTVGVLPAGTYTVNLKSTIAKATYLYTVCDKSSSRSATATFSDVNLSNSCNTVVINK